MEGIRQELTKILNTMNIPEERKDLNNQSNIGWLMRNIGIRNQDYPQLNDAVGFLCFLVWNK